MPAPRTRRLVAWRALALAAAIGCAPLPPASAAEDPAPDVLWERLRRGGLVVLVRHASAPGTYDPPGFRLDDCATQRNLSAEGREEARRLGEVIRARGVVVTEVRSSRWCRARDTASLAFGRYEPWPALDSYAGRDRSALPQRAALVREAIDAWRGPGTLALVSHQFVISEVTGRPLGEGELIVVEPRPGGMAVLGTLRPQR